MPTPSEAQPKEVKCSRSWCKNPAKPGFKRCQKCLEYFKAYYISHRQERRASARKFYRNHRDEERARNKKWYRENPWWENQKKILRRRLKAQGHCISKQALIDKANFFGNKCAYCGASDQLVWDHVKPLAKKGPHFLCNLQLLCCTCNSRKRDKWSGPWKTVNVYRLKLRALLPR
jgi:HNH endonuclease